MNRFLLGVCMMFSTTLSMLHAQVDGEAKALLDKLSEKTKSYKAVEVAFSFFIEGRGLNQESRGVLKMKGDLYQLQMDSLVVVSDGKTVITYRADVNEAQRVPVNELEEDALTPQTMFTIYEKGFKGKIKEKKTVGGRKITIIDLFPTNPKDKDYSIVRLDIDEDKLQIIKALVIGKNGTKYTYRIEKLTPDKDFPASIFVFDASKYPGVTMVD